MPVPMTEEQLEAYRATARRTRAEESQRAVDRLDRAREAAREGARILRERFGASSVMVFGSLAEEEWFGASSDIDFAATGVREEDYFVAVAALQGLLGEFEADLVDLDRCTPGLREGILAGGFEL